MGNAASLVASIAVPLAGGVINGILSQKDIVGWYKKLNKPKWTPPNWLFGPAWGVLYVSMGTASWFVLKASGAKKALPLSLYGAQLLLNWAWQPLFFKAHRLNIALVDSAAMVGMTAAATVTMSRVAGNKVVLPLMLPYLGWISFATALNFRLMQLNPDAHKTPTDSVPEIAKDTAEDVKSKKDAAVEKVQETTDKVSSAVDTAAQKVPAKVEEVSAAAEEVPDKAHEAVDAAGEGAHEAVAAAVVAVTPSS